MDHSCGSKRGLKCGSHHSWATHFTSIFMVCTACGGESSHSFETLDHWQDSKRFQYHVARFSSKMLERVLQRYSDSLSKLNNFQLQRYATHVAAWVAAPKCGAAVKLLAVDLLRCYLEQLKVQGINCCPCLLTGLKLIWQTQKDDLYGSGPWAALRDVMPAEVLSNLEISLMRPEKSVRLLQKAIQLWRNKSSGERCSFVEGLEAELQLQDEVEDSGDQREVETNRLESIFRRAVAALTAPRLKREAECHQGQQEPLDPDSEQTLDRSLAACRSRPRESKTHVI